MVINNMLDTQDKKELAEVERAINDTFVYDDYGKNSRGYNKCLECPLYRKCQEDPACRF